MKTNSLSKTLGLAFLSTALAVGTGSAKGGSGNGNGNAKGNGKKAAAHSEKQKAPKKAKAAKPDKGKAKDLSDTFENDRKDFEKKRSAEKKAYAKERAKFDKEWKKFQDRRFRDEERDEVVGYFAEYQDREMGLPPGLAKQYRDGRPLPPGWREKVERGYVIDEEWDSYFYPVDYARFPAVERVPDSRLYWVGDRVVQVYEPRREIMDVIRIPTISLD